jgi:hypothetical protein
MVMWFKNHLMVAGVLAGTATVFWVVLMLRVLKWFLPFIGLTSGSC